jgi:hypothetical protein
MAVRDRRQRRDRKDLAGIAQRKEEAARTALDREPRLAARLGLGRLQPVGEPALQIAQCLLVGLSRRPCRRAARGLGPSPLQLNAWILLISSVGSTGLTM